MYDKLAADISVALPSSISIPAIPTFTDLLNQLGATFSDLVNALLTYNIANPDNKALAESIFKIVPQIDNYKSYLLGNETSFISIAGYNMTELEVNLTTAVKSNLDPVLDQIKAITTQYHVNETLTALSNMNLTSLID